MKNKGDVCVFDLETNGLLRDVTQIWLLVIKNLNDQSLHVFRNNHSENSIPEGLEILSKAHRIVAHNGCNYDVPVIQKLYPDIVLPQCIDTVLLSRILYPDIKNHPFGGNSLECWGRHLRCLKMKPPDSLIEGWSEEAEAYCINDVLVGEKVYQYLKKRMSRFIEAIKIEHAIAPILIRQYLNGVGFDEDAALRFQMELNIEITDTKAELQKIFPPKYIETKTPEYWEADDGFNIIRFPTKGDAKKAGYKDNSIRRGPNRIKEEKFNPGSRQQIVDRFIEKYQWEPKVFTDSGSPVMDEKVLSTLEFDEARTLERYLLLCKRESQLLSWLEHLDLATKRIHGGVNQLGCVSGRMSHSSPNLGQVPAGYSPFGEQSRRCFGPRQGWLQIGADASGLELRALAHELSRWDDGAYAKIIADSDIHTHNQQMAGLETRDCAKTFIYAFIYGAGDAKLGTTIIHHSSLTPEQKEEWKQKGSVSQIGKRLRARFLKNIPALKELKKWIKIKYDLQGYLTGLDGRPLPIRYSYLALNTLLQSHGAVLMKKGLIILDHDLQSLHGLCPGKDYEFMLNIHDEWQLESRPEYAETIGRQAVSSIKQAGIELGFKCDLDGEYKIGKNWFETH